MKENALYDNQDNQVINEPVDRSDLINKIIDKLKKVNKDMEETPFGEDSVKTEGVKLTLSLATDQNLQSILEQLVEMGRYTAKLKMVAVSIDHNFIICPDHTINKTQSSQDNNESSSKPKIIVITELNQITYINNSNDSNSRPNITIDCNQITNGNVVFTTTICKDRLTKIDITGLNFNLQDIYSLTPLSDRIIKPYGLVSRSQTDIINTISFDKLINTISFDKSRNSLIYNIDSITNLINRINDLILEEYNNKSSSIVRLSYMLFQLILVKRYMLLTTRTEQMPISNIEIELHRHTINTLHALSVMSELAKRVSRLELESDQWYKIIVQLNKLSNSDLSLPRHNYIKTLHELGARTEMAARYVSYDTISDYTTPFKYDNHDFEKFGIV
jgi:hypothetical protein